MSKNTTVDIEIDSHDDKKEPAFSFEAGGWPILALGLTSPLIAASIIALTLFFVALMLGGLALCMVVSIVMGVLIGVFAICDTFYRKVKTLLFAAKLKRTVIKNKEPAPKKRKAAKEFTANKTEEVKSKVNKAKDATAKTVKKAKESTAKKAKASTTKTVNKAKDATAKTVKKAQHSSPKATKKVKGDKSTTKRG